MIGNRFRLPTAVVATLLTVLAASGSASATATNRVPHTFSVALSASQHDATLLQIGFPHGGRRALSTSALHVRVVGPLGDDYIALAAPKRVGRRGPEALLVLANRPSALLDPVSVHLRISARASLGKPVLVHLANLLYGVHPRRPSGLCTLTLGSAPLDPTALMSLGHRGTAIGGFSIAEALAATYDAACAPGLDAQALKSALAAPTASEGTPGEPSPVPPAPGPPGCTRCEPAPGFACPLIASTAVCVAGRDETGLAAADAAH